MTTYTSQPIEAPLSASAIYDRISDFSKLGGLVASLPDEARAKLGDVTFTADTITIPANALGTITMRVSERVPAQRLALKAENSPVPMTMAINLKDKAAEATDITATIDIDIPVFLRPMLAKVEPMLHQSVEKFAEMIANFVKIQ